MFATAKQDSPTSAPMLKNATRALGAPLNPRHDVAESGRGLAASRALLMRHSVASRYSIANDLFTKTDDHVDASWHIGDGRAVIIASRCTARSLNLLNVFRLHQILRRFIVISSPCRNLRAGSAIEPGQPRVSATGRAF